MSAKELQNDLSIITRHIEKDVPDPFYACPKSAYDSVKKKVYAELKDSMTSIQFYRTVYPLIQILNNSSFTIKPNEKILNLFKKDSLLFFPFKVLIQGNRLFVLSNLSSDKTIQKGNEIIAINGLSIKTIINKLRSCNFKSRGQEGFFERRYESSFYKWLYLIWGYNGRFSIKVLNHKETTVEGVPEKMVYVSSYPKDRKFYSFKILHKYPYKIGYIKVASLVLDKYPRKDSLDDFLQKTFKKIENDSIKKLVIDIRNNPGGNSNLGRSILNYITAKPLELIIGKKFFKNGKLITKMINVNKSENIKNRFLGKTILLINEMTYGAAQMMAAAFQYHHLGKIVGSAGVGTLYEIGSQQKIVLPNSDCTFYYPTKGFLLPGYEKNKKVSFVSDYQVYPTLQDRLYKKDTVLNFALGLLEKRDNPNMY